jgi:hypothetical protein
VACVAQRFYNDREPAQVYRGPQRPSLARDDPDSTPAASLHTEPPQMTTPCIMPRTDAHGGRGTPATQAGRVRLALIPPAGRSR